jgi:hypothetical protein
MDQQSVPTSAAPEVFIEEVLGNLQVKGWERPEVQTKGSSGDGLTLEEKDDTVHLSCRGDLSVRVPYGASLQIGRVNGEARIKLLEEPLTINQVRLLTLRTLPGCRPGAGHAAGKDIAGDLQADQVSGNDRAGCPGQIFVDQVGGNLTCGTPAAQLR